MEDLIKLKNFLAAVSEDTQGFLDKIKEDKDYTKFFLDDLTVGIFKRLTRERSRDDKYLDVISGILEIYMNIFMQFLRLGIYNQ